MSTLKPPRRWFVFSPRTLLVGTTAIGAWLGLELRIVRERHAELLWANEHNCAVTSYAELKDDCGLDIGSRRRRFPEVRRLFGDKPIAAVVLPRNGDAAQGDLDRIAENFHEAFVFFAEPPEYCPSGQAMPEMGDE